MTDLDKLRADTEAIMDRNRAVPVSAEDFEELCAALKELRDAEWMVTCDWTSNRVREAVLARTANILAKVRP